MVGSVLQVEILPEIAAIFATDPDATDRKLLPVRIDEVTRDGLWRPLAYVDFVGQSSEACIKRLRDATLGIVRPTTSPPFPRQLDKALGGVRFPGALPAIWNVPHSRNIHFRGRDDVLQRLHEGKSIRPWPET